LDCGILWCEFVRSADLSWHYRVESWEAERYKIGAADDRNIKPSTFEIYLCGICSGRFCGVWICEAHASRVKDAWVR
jgi:hypothetical protein